MRAAGVLLSRTMRHSYSAKLPELLEARPRTRFNDRFRVALRTARLRNVGGTERPIAEQFKFIDERLKNLHHWLSRIRRGRALKGRSSSYQIADMPRSDAKGPEHV